ncbi:hypothetical protein ACTFIZ_004372 [Dictyostelium cf. discoideum]
MNVLKITIVTDDGESTISGTAHPLPTPLIYPPPIYLRFSDYKTEGKLWDKKQFHIKSGSIEYKNEEFDIPSSQGSCDKVDDFMNIKINLNEVPRKIFHLKF